MERPMKKTKLPRTDSIQELAEFWDTHDLTDFEDELEEVGELRKEMKAQRIFRASRKTPEEKLREQKLRERLQKERPSLEDLVRAGDCDADAIMTMGMYFDVQRALQALKLGTIDAGKETRR
jgi:hypothetical protein